MREIGKGKVVEREKRARKTENRHRFVKSSMLNYIIESPNYVTKKRKNIFVFLSSLGKGGLGKRSMPLDSDGRD